MGKHTQTTIFTVIFLLVSTMANAETLFTKAENGTVSLNTGLTHAQCKMALKKAKGEPTTPEEIKSAEQNAEKNYKAFEKRAAEWQKLNPCKDISKGCPIYSEVVSARMTQPYDIVQAECLK